jgi:hypothetical protein
MVQAADVVGAIVAHSMKAAAAERPLDRSELDLVQLTLPALLLDIPVGHAVISDEVRAQVSRVLLDTLPNGATAEH